MTEANTKHDPRTQALDLLALVWPEAKLGRTSNEDLNWLLEIAAIVQGDHRRTMAETLANYRKNYEDTAAYSGRLSKHNGDLVAQALAGSEPKTVIRAAELLLGLDPGELWARYERLNRGQQRMNAGNRIRAGVKREDFGPEEVVKAMTQAAKAA